MTVTARMVAVVRRAKYGRLSIGEPEYDPPISDAEIAEMRQFLADIGMLAEPPKQAHRPDSDGASPDEATSLEEPPKTPPLTSSPATDRDDGSGRPIAKWYRR